MTVRVSGNKCPSCGKFLDMATAVNDPRAELAPTAGDLSMCISCGTFLQYKEDMSYRIFTHDEIVDLDTETRSQLFKAHEVWSQLPKEKL